MKAPNEKRIRYAPERRNARDDRRASRRLLRAVFDAIPHSLYVKSADGRDRMVNKAFARLVGRLAKEVARPADGRVRATADRLPPAIARGRVAGESPECLDDFVRLHDAERGDLWIRAIKVPLRDEAGGVIGSAELLQDFTAEKQAEEAARRSETQLKEAQKLAQVGSWEFDLAGDALTCSDEMYRIFEVDRENSGASYDAFLAVIHPEDKNAVFDGYTRSLRSREPYAMVHRLLLPGGRIKFVQQHGVTHYGIGGVPLRSVGTVQDITERKLTEQALQLLSSGLAHLSGDAFFNELARHVARLLNVEIGFVGKYVAKPIPHLRTLGFCVDGTISPPIEFDLEGTPCGKVVGQRSVVFMDGVQQLFPRHWVFADLGVSGYAGAPLFDKEHEPVGVIGVMSRKPLRQTRQVESLLHLFAVRTGAEIRRQQTEERFQLLFEFSPDANLMVNAEGLVILANRQAEALLGYPREELIGLSVEELMPDASRKSHVAMRQRFLANSTPRMMGSGRPNLFARRKDGAVFPADISLNPMQMNDGTFVMVSMRDISARVQAEAERQALEAQLRQAQKMEALGRLAGGVAHDFNNMLQVITGYTELASLNAHNSAQVSEALSAVMHAADRAGQLTRHLLAFSRQRVLKRSLLRLDALVQDSSKMARRLLGEHIELAVHIGESPPMVDADASLLEQVLLNLCVNARDAMPQGGRLSIEVTTVAADDAFCAQCPWAKPGPYALVVVSDTGTGMAAEVRQRAFEPFFTTKEAGKGTGLGLSMSYGIVQQHGGMIEVDSVLGRGTTFRVYLPVADAAADERASQPAAEAPGGAETVLVAEDEPSVRKLVAVVLRRKGYRVIEAQDGAEAVALFAGHRQDLDLVILDMMMPRLGGREAYQQLRGLDPDVPVLFSTGYVDSAGEEFARRVGIQILRKPYTAAELLKAVRAALD